MHASFALDRAPTGPVPSGTDRVFFNRIFILDETLQLFRLAVITVSPVLVPSELLLKNLDTGWNSSPLDELLSVCLQCLCPQSCFWRIFILDETLQLFRLAVITVSPVLVPSELLLKNLDTGWNTSPLDELLSVCLQCLCPQSYFWVLIYRSGNDWQLSWLLACG